MSIHKRLAEVHLSLMNMKIKKSGWNGHKKFHYYELEDIMGPIITECHKQEITVEFPYCEDVAILKLVDWNNPKDYVVYRIGIPGVIVPEKNPNNQIVQTLGANISYLQRYLLKLAFPCLNDKDVVDFDGAGEEHSSTEASSAKDEVTELPMGELVLQAKEKLLKKGVDEKEITYKALKNTILQMKNWKVPERRCILNYFKQMEASK